MPTTRGYRYPSAASSVNVPQDIQNLATDVDTDVSAMFPTTVEADDGAATDSTFTSVFPTFVNATSAGTLGVVFVAPKTGRVKIHFGCGQGRTTSAGGSVVLDYELRQGNVIGSGTVVKAAHSKPSIQIVGVSDGASQNRALSGGFDLVSGLTPGFTYNALLAYATTGGTATVNRRAIMVEPAS